jgi:hypothetical protein
MQQRAPQERQQSLTPWSLRLPKSDEVIFCSSYLALPQPTRQTTDGVNRILPRALSNLLDLTSIIENQQLDFGE